MSLALALHGGPYYIGMALLSVLFFIGAEADHDQPAEDLRPGAGRERARGRACQSVRHRAEQHAAWPVHVRRRRPSGGDEPPFQRNDAADRRSRASRRQRARHRRGLRRRRHDFGRERQAASSPEIENSQAGEITTADPGQRERPRAVMDVPADGRRRHRRAGRRHHRTAQRRSPDQPSGALRRTDGAAQPRQFPRRDRAAAGDLARCRAAVGAAVRRSRPVQAGQRYAGPSLRRPAAVRGRRPAARDAAAGGFRRALRRRRVRRVPAEHQIRARTPPGLPAVSSTA